VQERKTKKRKKLQVFIVCSFQCAPSNMSLKRPRSPSPLHLELPSHNFFSSVIHVNIETTFSSIPQDTSDPRVDYFPYGFASFQLDSHYAPMTPHYVYVIDTSESMRYGRLDKAIRGLEASCHLLDPATNVSIFSFESRTKLIYSGPNPISTMNDIKLKLIAQGGTNIMEAIACSMEYSMNIIEKQKTPVVLLFMTDGEDTNLSQAIEKEKEQAINPFFKSLAQKKSGFSMHFVGISDEAAIKQLAFLAEIGNESTFVSIQDDNIVDVMGMLIGLTQEKCPNALEMNVKIVKENEEDKQEELIIKAKTIQLRKSMPTNVAFKIPFDKDNQWSSINITCDVTVHEIGNHMSMIKTFNKSIQLKNSLFDAKNINAKPLVIHALEEWANMNKHIAEFIHDGNFDPIFSLIDKMKAKLATFKDVIDDKDLEEIIRIERLMTDQEDLVHQSKIDHQRVLEVQTRALSAASTQRNSSMTLDFSSRSISMVQHSAVDRIRSISLALDAE
jgi:hypothetical protein